MANPANTTAYVGNDGRLWVDVTEAKTLTAADSGYVQNVIYANGVVTGPAAATNGLYIIRNGGVPVTNGPAGTGDDGNLISFDPAAADTIIGFNVADGTSADGKQLNNTAATAKVGDEITVRYEAGSTNGPVIESIKGIWAREA
jgi:hypothetical protein